jgi:anti-sigma factor RsiW
MSVDIHSLVGAYALDALDDIERVQFERHFTSCPACQAEVDSFLETTARLGAAAAETPPSSLRNRVLAEADVTRQRPPLIERSRRTLRRLVAPVAAAAAAVLVTLAYVGLLPPDRPTLDQVSAVLAAPDAETVQLQTTGEFAGRVVTSASSGQAVLAVSGLEEREDGRVYVLWAFRDGTPINEQSLTASEDGSATAIIVDDLATVSQVALTAEPDADVTAPTGPIVAQAEIS